MTNRYVCLISVLRETCLNCTCYHNSEVGKNVYDCGNQALTEIPSHYPHQTQLLLLHNNSIQKACYEYNFRQIEHLDLHQNEISKICPQFVGSIHSMKYVDLSSNRLKELPRNITELSNMTLLIGHNHFSCYCNVLWMAEWLNYSTINNLVKDYKHVICKGGKTRAKGRQIYTLTRENLDCIPPPIMVIVGAAVVMIFVLVAILTIFRHLDQIKWIIFLKTGTRLDEDTMEDVDAMHFDAIVAYRLICFRSYILQIGTNINIRVNNVQHVQML